MPRRPRTVGIESSVELAKKAQILEREMARQRAALERLKELSASRHEEAGKKHQERVKRSA